MPKVEFKVPHYIDIAEMRPQLLSMDTLGRVFDSYINDERQAPMKRNQITNLQQTVGAIQEAFGTLQLQELIPQLRQLQTHEQLVKELGGFMPCSFACLLFDNLCFDPKELMYVTSFEEEALELETEAFVNKSL